MSYIGQTQNRNSAEIMKIFETRIATYIDYNGNKSIMKVLSAPVR